MNHFDYKPLFLPKNQKFLFRILSFSIRVLFVVLGITFFTTQIGILRIFGFWMLLIFGFYFGWGKRIALKDLRFQHCENIADFCTQETLDVLLDAHKDAEYAHTENPQLMLMLKLLQFSSVRVLFRILRIDVRRVYRDVYGALSEKKVILDVDMQKQAAYTARENILPLTASAKAIAQTILYPAITPEILFLALVECGNFEVQHVCEMHGIQKEFVRAAFMKWAYRRNLKKSLGMQPLMNFSFGKGRVRWRTRTWSSRPTPFLDAHGIDLTFLAREQWVGFLIGHRKELQEVLSLANKGIQFSGLLVGNEGVGKQSLVWHLAWLIAHDKVAEELYDMRLIELHLGQLYGNSGEEFQQVLLRALGEASNAGNVILYIPDIETLFLSGITPSPLITLQPFLSGRSVSIIASTTPEGFARMKQQGSFMQMFSAVFVNEISSEEAIHLLTLEAMIQERMQKISITPQAIAYLVSLSKKYISAVPLPSSARGVLERAFGFAKKERIPEISEELIGDLVGQQSGIPVQKPEEDERETLQNLEEIIHRTLVDQEFAVREVSRVLRTYRAGFEKKGPVGVFLFIGPTGVGKTELAKTLARIYFQDKKQFLQLDMVAFQTPKDIDELIGSEDGSILGKLTEGVRQMPYGVLLLDEFEKAHPQVLNIFLPIFDEGSIQDGMGRAVDFKNTIIIATSNVHSQTIKKEIESGKHIEDVAKKLKNNLTSYFPAELINRFDSVVFFKPLSQDDLSKIINRYVDQLNGELQEKFGFSVDMTHSAKEKIIELGYEAAYGARPLKRAFEKYIKSFLATEVLAEKIKRNDKILVDYRDSFVLIYDRVQKGTA